MGSKNAIFTSGVNTSFSTELNETIYYPLLNYTSTEQTASYTASTGYTELKTFDVTSSGITKDVLIDATLATRGAYGTGGGSRTGSFEYKIDGVTISSTTVTALGVDTNISTVETLRHKIRYTPTSTQLTNGFTVSIEGKINSSSGTGGRAGVVGFDILGR